MELGMESSAIGLLKRAVELDGEGRFTESLVCYQEGIQLLLQIVKGKGVTDAKKKQFRGKISEYMDRAEAIKQHMETKKREGNYREQVEIKDNSQGFSYEKLLGRYFEGPCPHIEVEDPYIQKPHQFLNFLRFCELCVKKNCGVQEIVLVTRHTDMHGAMKSLIDDLQQHHSITLTVQISDTLHDREIRMSNGWVIKIGRGLDYFKPAPKNGIGFCDFDLRLCLETTVDIFHRKDPLMKYCG